MGYTTEFEGQIAIEPPLNAEELAYLNKFNDTRRMNRTKSPYYVDGKGMAGQDHETDIVDYNSPAGQPGLWCGWKPNDAGDAIEWDGGEKFYDSAEWMKYLIEHFIGLDPIARRVDASMSFLQGHVCNGEITAQGEDSDDKWKLIVKDNKVMVARVVIDYAEPHEI